MHFRQDRKWKNQTQTNDTTFSEALPSSGILDAILVKVRVQNASAMYDRPERLISDHISSIVVKADGVSSFKDILGQTNLAEYAIEYGSLPPCFIDEMSANYQLMTFPIMFGRRFNDGKFGLDLSRYGETRLEVTNDYASADLQSTTSIFYDIDLYFMEDGPTPPNFIGTSQISSHTWTAASQEQTFKVPTKFKVRRIIFSAFDPMTSATSAPSNKTHRNLRYLKYTYKSGGVILADDDLFRNDQDALWGFPDFLTVSKHVEPRSTYYTDTMIGRPTGIALTPAYSSDPGADLEVAIDQRMEQHMVYRRADAGYQGILLASGFGPLGHLCLHEDVPDDLEGYLNPETEKDVEIKIGNSTSGATSGTVRFITEHIRPNGS